MEREETQVLFQKALDLEVLKKKILEAETKIPEVGQLDTSSLSDAVHALVSHTLAASQEPWAARFRELHSEAYVVPQNATLDDIGSLIQDYAIAKANHAAILEAHASALTACRDLKSQLALQLQEYKVLHETWCAAATENEKSVITAIIPRP